MSAHGTSHIHCSNDGNKSCDDCHHFLFWDQTGGQQSSSGDSEETGVCIARDDRAALGRGVWQWPAKGIGRQFQN